jgi:hypothetical protein
MNDKHLQEVAKLFHRAEPAPTVSEYEREQQSFRANYELLKTERQARELIKIVGNGYPGS